MRVTLVEVMVWVKTVKHVCKINIVMAVVVVKEAGHVDVGKV